LSKADLDVVSEALFKETCHQKPWQRTPDPRPDLGWYTPSCSLEHWTHKSVKIELGQGIAYVTFDRPEQGNSLNASMFLGLLDAVYGLHMRKDIRCVVFSGEGKLFCGGEDPKFDGNFIDHKFAPRAEKTFAQLKERAVKHGAMKDLDANPGPLLQAKLWESMGQLPQFSICLVNGSAVGAGIGMLVCVDMVISVKTAYFSLPEVREGLVPAIYAPYLTAKVGASFAKYMVASGRNFPAEDLKRAGLLSELVDTVEEGHGKIRDICEVLTACGPRSVEAAKQLVVGVGGQPIAEGIMFFTASLLAMVTVSEEAKVGMVAVQTKAPKPWEEKPITVLH